MSLYDARRNTTARQPHADLKAPLAGLSMPHGAPLGGIPALNMSVASKHRRGTPWNGST